MPRCRRGAPRTRGRHRVARLFERFQTANIGSRVKGVLNVAVCTSITRRSRLRSRGDACRVLGSDRCRQGVGRHMVWATAAAHGGIDERRWRFSSGKLRIAWVPPNRSTQAGLSWGCTDPHRGCTPERSSSTGSDFFPSDEPRRVEQKAGGSVHQSSFDLTRLMLFGSSCRIGSRPT